MKSNFDIFDSDEEDEEEEENNEEEEQEKSENSKSESPEIITQDDIKPKNIDQNKLDTKNKTQSNSSNINYGIFILGLPYETTENELRALFSPYGEILKINLPRYQNTQRNVGYCYIYYATEEEAVRSLALNKHKIGKRYMEISLVKVTNNHYKDNDIIDPDDVPLDCTTAFIKNLSYNTTEKEVDDKFSSCGPIEAIRFVYDFQTRKFKGFCYIDFKEHKGLLKALKLNGSFFNGRKIHVDYEQGKPKKSCHKSNSYNDVNADYNLLRRKRYEE